MKKALLTLAAVAMAGSAYAQGTILFSNADLTGPTGTYNAIIKMPDGVANADSSFSVGLFLGATQLATDTIFGTTGLFLGSGDAVVVPGNNTGSTPTLTVKAWETSAGSYDAAVTGNKIRGELSFTTRALGGPNPSGPATVPADMGNFGNPATGIGFVMVPEPSTYALGIAGLGALAMMRRRK
jgi:hypothetical protein